MCDKCGDPNCDGTGLGTSIDQIEFTEESNKQAVEIIDLLRTMCVNLKDKTGQTQVEKIAETGIEQNIRTDQLLLMMVDIYYRYLYYRVQFAAWREKLEASMKEENPLDVPSIDVTNKKLN